MTDNQLEPNQGNMQAWVVCISAALFFFYIFIQMNFFSAIEPALFKRFHMSSSAMATVSQMYFYGNVLFLIPAGLLLDHFSTRKLLLIATTLCVLCTWWFAYSGSLLQAEIARFFIGVVGAFCLLAPVRLATRWFPPQKMALVVGIVVTMAMLGGMVAQAPFVMLTDHLGYAKALYADVALGLIIIFLIYLNVKDVPAHMQGQADPHASNISLISALGRVLKNKQNWLAGLFASLINLPVFWLGGFWGVNYLVQAQHMSRADASSINGMIFLGMIFGSPFFGWWSDKMKKRKPPMLIGIILSIILILTIIWLPHLSYWFLMMAFFMLGFVISAQVIAYPVVAESNSLQFTGFAESLASVLIMSGGFTLSFFAYLLNYYWIGDQIQGMPIYTNANYHLALMALPAAFIVAFILVLFLRETHCRSESV